MAFKPPVVRSYGGYDADAVSDATGLECKDVSRTRQADAVDADINNIVRNFGLTGRLPENLRIPTYGDFEFVGDYQSALNAVKAADEAFMQLPADIRAKFENSPQQYLDFVTNPANAEEMVNLGLAKKAIVHPEDLPPVTPPA